MVIASSLLSVCMFQETTLNWCRIPDHSSLLCVCVCGVEYLIIVHYCLCVQYIVTVCVGVYHYCVCMVYRSVQGVSLLSVWCITTVCVCGVSLCAHGVSLLSVCMMYHCVCVCVCVWCITLCVCGVSLCVHGVSLLSVCVVYHCCLYVCFRKQH